MIKVMIVDDEPTMRNLLISLINWESYGYKIVGEAYNGENAMSLLEELNYAVDIIITDIKMPRMNGLELIRQAMSKNTNINFIVLSAYDEFNMVRQAFNDGCKDYLLKYEVDKDNLLKVLAKIREKIAENMNEGNILISKIKQYIDKNYNKDLSLTMVAEKFAFSSSYLSRLFSEKVGDSFSSYLTKVRIRAAVKYMNESNLRIYEIAEAVGYTSAAHFSKAFKKVTGKNPMQYINS